MPEAENPYQSPVTDGCPPSDIQWLDTTKPPPNPALTKTLTLALWMNVASVPLSGLLPDLRSALQRNGANLLAEVVGAMGAVNIFWLLIMWPMTSLAALLYATSTDRDTRWWVLKAVTAAAMLFVWLCGCGLLFTLVLDTTTSGDDLD